MSKTARLSTSPIYQVVTIQEASRLFHCHENTIRYHIDHNHLIYRKSGHEKSGQYLIDFQSLVRLWGFTPQINS